MSESHDSHDESSANSPIRGKDEEPTQVHGGDEDKKVGTGEAPGEAGYEDRDSKEDMPQVPSRPDESQDEE